MSTMMQNNKLNKSEMSMLSRCAALYGFEVEDALSRLSNMSNMSSKKLKLVLPKSSFVLPFNNTKNDKCCSGLRYSDGLYTQCEIVVKDGNNVCAVCEKGGMKYGTIDARMSEGDSFKDPSGKFPVHYSKIMKKLKVTKEDVLAEALKMGKSVDECHFVVQEEKRGRPKAKKVKVEKEDKKKGRPKKSPKGLELDSSSSDLFADLIANSSSEVEDLCIEEFNKTSLEAGVKLEIVSVIVSEKVSDKDLDKVSNKVSNKVSDTDLDKAKKNELKALDKAKKDEEKALKDEAKALEKASKDEAKALEKASKEVKEKAPKKVVEKAPKKEKEVKVVEVKVVEEEEEDKVERITKEGVKCKASYKGEQYLKSKKSGIVYNLEQDVIGKWSEDKKEIIFNPIVAELAADEEYESDDE